MAVNTFTFGSITSSTYGIYVSGEALFNAPKRDAEVIQIPGRDGDYILDKGSFENIEVTYRVFNQEKDLTDFRTKLANLRSALCSQKGYQRLADTFHPNEYRMAAFIDGIDVKPVKYNTASEFEITFNCKPQRFLTSGETAVSVASGGKVTNPTLFDAKPQLQVWGYGDIDLGGAEISIANATYGNVLLAQSGTDLTITLDMSVMNAGDSFTVSGINRTIEAAGVHGYRASWKNISGTNCSATTGYSNELVMTPDDITFVKGTASTLNFSVSATLRVTKQSDHTNVDTSTTITGSVAYDGDSTITISTPISPSSISNTHLYGYVKTPDIFGTSTKSMLGSPLYIDLDIGEAYNTDSGTAVSVNNAVSIPAELPVLPPGDTTITYDNTITQLKVLPRWWKV